MTSKTVIAAFFLILLSIIPIPNIASAQTASDAPSNGRVEGITRDLVGALVPKAVIVFQSDAATREVVSDESGKFRIDLPAAVYKVSVQRFGIFDPYQRKNIKVRNGKTRKLEIVLTYDLKKHPPVI